MPLVDPSMVDLYGRFVDLGLREENATTAVFQWMIHVIRDRAPVMMMMMMPDHICHDSIK